MNKRKLSNKSKTYTFLNRNEKREIYPCKRDGIMIKDPKKLCSYCRRLKEYSYVMSLDDEYIMKVKCREFPQAGYIKSKDKDDTCVGFINVNMIPVPPRKYDFIKEHEFSINI